MSDFSTRIDAFLAETFRLEPDVLPPRSASIATTIAGPTCPAAGRAERLALIDALARRVRGRDRADRRRSHRSRPADRRARGRAVRRDRAVRGRLGPAGMGLSHRRRPVHAQRPRVRSAGRPAGVDRRAARGPAGASSTRPRRRSSGPPIGRSARSRPRPRSSSSPGSTSSSPTRWPRPRAAAADGPGRRRAPAAARRRRRDRTRRSRAFETSPARGRPAGERRRGPARSRAVRGEDAPHDALGDAHPGAHPGRRRTGVRRGPGGDGPPRPRAVAGLARRRARPDDDGALVRGVLDAIAFEHPDAPTSCSTSVARRTPGSRPSAPSAT